MASAGAEGLLKLIRQKQDLQWYRERHWSGSFADYMEIVMANPRVARNAYQRLYDMILSHGFSEYTRHHERYVHYRLFDDPVDAGRDAVFGLDAPLMRLVHNIKSAAFGYGTEKRILLLHGPVGSSASPPSPPAQEGPGAVLRPARRARSTPTAGRPTPTPAWRRRSGARCTRSRCT